MPKKTRSSEQKTSLLPLQTHSRVQRNSRAPERHNPRPLQGDKIFGRLFVPRFSLFALSPQLTTSRLPSLILFFVPLAPLAPGSLVVAFSCSHVVSVSSLDFGICLLVLIKLFLLFPPSPPSSLSPSPSHSSPLHRSSLFALWSSLLSSLPICACPISPCTLVSFLCVCCLFICFCLSAYSISSTFLPPMNMYSHSQTQIAVFKYQAFFTKKIGPQKSSRSCTHTIKTGEVSFCLNFVGLDCPIFGQHVPDRCFAFSRGIMSAGTWPLTAIDDRLSDPRCAGCGQATGHLSPKSQNMFQVHFL